MVRISTIGRRCGTGLALFALALQLALSFGHVHAEDFAAASFEHAANGAPSAPGDRHDHDDCPVCAVVHIAGTLVLPVPPATPVPPHRSFVLPDAPDHSAVPRALRLSFHARAPPTV